MREIEQRVLEAIDVEGMLSYLYDLVAVPSLSGTETAAQEHVAAQMKRMGLEVDVWELDFEALSRHPAYCVEVERQHGLGVVGTLGVPSGKGNLENGRSLIFNGHVDVVPAGDLANWRYPPWQGTLSDGRVYGRGALDMKGGLSCALFAAKAIRDAGVDLAGQLIIQSVIGEEDGGVGTLAAIERDVRADAAVVMEPTELMVAPAQAGALNFRVTVPGKAAHGCVREEGVSAIEKFIPLYEALMAFEKARNSNIADPLYASYEIPYAITVGTVKAGTWASTVAETLTFEGRFGVAVGEDVPTAKKALEETIAHAAQADLWLRDHEPQVSWWGGQFAPASIRVDHPIVTDVKQAFLDVTGTAPKVQGMTYGSDMRLLVNEGDIPTILFGPGDVRRAHRPDEFVPVDDLITCTQTLALTALRFCGVRGDKS